MSRPQFFVVNRLPDEHALALGRFIADAAELELMLEAAIWQLMGTSQLLGRVLTSRLEMRSKIDTVDAILKLIPAQPYPEWEDWRHWWDELRPKFHEIRDLRSWVAHGAWSRTSPTTAETALTRKGNHERVAGKKPISLQQIERARSHAAEAIKCLFDLIQMLSPVSSNGE